MNNLTISLLALIMMISACQAQDIPKKTQLPNVKSEIPACPVNTPKFNHFAYNEYSGNKVAVGSGQSLHPEAATAFLAMQQAARKDGVTLTPISTFRSKEQQTYLFYEVAIQRGQTLEQRAKVSAPPGHSEHHTGLAIDINSLEQSFGKTQAYRWLQTNAVKFGFEESFPQGNSQGVSWEPWHWRYVQGEFAQQTFCHLK